VSAWAGVGTGDVTRGEGSEGGSDPCRGQERGLPNPPSRAATPQPLARQAPFALGTPRGAPAILKHPPHGFPFRATQTPGSSSETAPFASPGRTVGAGGRSWPESDRGHPGGVARAVCRSQGQWRAVVCPVAFPGHPAVSLSSRALRGWPETTTLPVTAEASPGMMGGLASTVVESATLNVLSELGDKTFLVCVCECVALGDVVVQPYRWGAPALCAGHLSRPISRTLYRLLAISAPVQACYAGAISRPDPFRGARSSVDEV